MEQQKNVAVKRHPIRRCVGCGEHFPKTDLVRVLRTPEGEIVLDKTGKRSGRGAYICKSTECLKRARTARRLESSLECPIPEDVYGRLENELVGE